MTTRKSEIVRRLKQPADGVKVHFKSTPESEQTIKLADPCANGRANRRNSELTYRYSTFSRWKNPFVDQPFSQIDAMIEIDLQGDDRGPACRSSAHQQRTVPAKMP